MVCMLCGNSRGNHANAEHDFLERVPEDEDLDGYIEAAKDE